MAGEAMCTKGRGRARLLASALVAAGAVVLTSPGPARAQTAAGPLSGAQLMIVPAGGTVLTVDGRPYHGSMVLGQDGSSLAVVDRLPFEQYVDGIAEMPSNWPSASLEAQAIAARTYALWQVLTHQPGPAGGQICASDACQVYAGMSKEEGPDGSNWVAAVAATRGDVLLYEGRVIEALYGSSDGGQTVDGGVSWLPSVSDPQDSLSPEHQWSWSEPLSSIAPILGVPAHQTLTSLVSSTTAITASLQGPGGATSSMVFTPDQFHSLLNAKMAPPAGLDLPLPSGRYSVSTYGTDVKVAGLGDGNGLGLSQYGALGKALAGWSAGQILANYYGPARPAALPADEQPQTIAVTLLDQGGPVSVGATGPAQVLGPSGQVVASTSGPQAWSATTGAGGVGLQPVSGPVADSPDVSRDLAPVPTRQAAPVDPTASAPGQHEAPPPAPTTTTTTVPAPVGTASGASVSPDTAPTADALGPAPGAAAVTSRTGGEPWGWGLLAAAALGAVCAGGMRILRRIPRLPARVETVPPADGD